MIERNYSGQCMKRALQASRRMTYCPRARWVSGETGRPIAKQRVAMLERTMDVQDVSPSVRHLHEDAMLILSFGNEHHVEAFDKLILKSR